MAAVQTTTLNKGWLLKLGLFFAVLAGFGVWALIDGLVIYPRRGELDASYKLYVYLQAARDTGRLTRTDVAVDNPGAALAELASRERDLIAAAQGKSVLTLGGPSPKQAQMELARLAWLRSLRNVWRLESAASRIESDPGAQLAALTAQWKVNQPPKPLSGMDMMFQWVFTALGFGGALWIAATILRAKGKKFTWDAEAGRLTLPDGASITAADIAEFDKRRWHKYYVTLALKGGGSRTLDLLRHVPLEEWVLTLERTANPPAPGGDNGGPAAPAGPDSPVGAALGEEAGRGNG